MILTDSGAWFASVVPWDANHAAASAWLKQNREPLLTTDYLIDETLTLLRVRREPARAAALGEQLFSGRLATVYFLTESDIRKAWEIFHDYADKDWSFTDCTSKVVMEKLGLTKAFSFDQHLRQFGTVLVVP
ncbi:MAG TPA: PIN domain-containing protein [Gemmataceae bacterium]|nr:PIN domain-containing protein [Gemmataceae bacterium]